jgi:hypothetical protein
MGLAINLLLGCGGDASGPPDQSLTIAKVSGDLQEGIAGETLLQPLTVRVTDAQGTGVPGVQVEFAVTAGGGTIAGSPATTDAQGVATAGPWILGTTVAEQSVSASVGSAAVTFIAHMQVCETGTVTVDAAISASIAAGDCTIGGAWTDRYSLQTASAQAVRISLTSSAFTPRLRVVSSAGLPVAANDQVANSVTYCVAGSSGCHSTTSSAAGSAVKMLVGPGERRLDVSAAGSAGSGGDYQLAVTPASSSVSACETVFIERGVTTTQQLAATDCTVDFGGGVIYYSDDIKIYLSAGSTLDVRMSSSAFQPWLDFFSPSGQYLGGCVEGSVADCTFNAPVDGYYLLAASSFEEQATGSYSLTVD